MKFSTLFASFRSKSALKSLTTKVNRISSFEPLLEDKTDEELKSSFLKLNSQPESEKVLQGFAIVREMSKRVLGLRHFDVQMIGGLSLISGNLAEMRTGEGKTLTISAPACVKALDGKGVHIVTSNSYLAHRDSEQLKPLYEALGLSVGFIHPAMSLEEKKAAYRCDITYGVGSDFGFDYLRDNLVNSLDERMQRGLHCAIVDEVDSILIDDARTPLIISGEGVQKDELFIAINKVVRKLKISEHFEIDLKERVVTITEAGYEEVEEGLIAEGLIAPGSNIYSSANLHVVRLVHSAVTVYGLYKIDRDYVVHRGEIVLIDQGTGRKMPGRRMGDGIHEAIEAKEGVAIHAGTETTATITYQNFFRMYGHLSGLSGTAMTEAEEFVEFYNLEPVVVPTNKPIARIAHSDRVFSTKAQKFAECVNVAAQCFEKGQPILIGCASVRDAEVMSQLLKQAKVEHEVLTAKHIEREAHIIANAGRKFAVTVATNMAGRGTDISLGGERPQKPLTAIPDNSSPEQIKALTEAAALQEEQFQEQLRAHKAEQEEVIALGGLFVLGTERNGIRRVDNQLAGRAGRQGDPGEVQFMLSLEDELLRIFGESRQFKALLKVMDGGAGLGGHALSKLITSAQSRVEGQGFEARKQLMQFDSVLANQRDAVYSLRDQLMKEGCDTFIENSLEEVLSNWSRTHLDETLLPEQWDAAELKLQFYNDFGIEVSFVKWLHTEELDENQVVERLRRELRTRFESITMPPLTRVRLTLELITKMWTEQLTALDELREGINLHAHGGQNPVHTYNREAFALFNEFTSALQFQVIQQLLNSKEVEPAQKAAPTTRQRNAQAHARVALALDKRPVSRNEPCPCGSGVKYKRCHGNLT